MDTSGLMYPKPKDKKIKNKKLRTKSCDISPKIKEIVWNRDEKKCIFCGRYVPKACANAHLVKRSQGGLGVEENIFTACLECHYEEDFGKSCRDYEIRAEEYLKSVYGFEWDRNKLIFRKY